MNDLGKYAKEFNIAINNTLDNFLIDDLIQIICDYDVRTYYTEKLLEFKIIYKDADTKEIKTYIDRFINGPQPAYECIYHKLKVENIDFTFPITIDFYNTYEMNVNTNTKIYNNFQSDVLRSGDNKVYININYTTSIRGCISHLQN